VFEVGDDIGFAPEASEEFLVNLALLREMWT
jgi:hypothetical protein